MGSALSVDGSALHRRREHSQQSQLAEIHQRMRESLHRLQLAFRQDQISPTVSSQNVSYSDYIKA